MATYDKAELYSLVLELVKLGGTSPAIAALLGVSRSYVHSIRGELGIRAQSPRALAKRVAETDPSLRRRLEQWTRVHSAAPAQARRAVG